MTVKNSIGWVTRHTSNVITGCKGPTGKPCSYCWAVPFRKRLAGVKGTMQRSLAVFGVDINHPVFDLGRMDKLHNELQRARKPRRIFFASMGDLGYDGNYREIYGGQVSRKRVRASIVRSYARMLFEENPRHTFLVLSKQPKGLLDTDWPENVHVGVSVSRSYLVCQRRIKVLRRIKCGLRWVSVEPLHQIDFDPLYLKGAQWVVVGVETGRRASDPILYREAARRIIRWCDNNEVPVFIKDNILKALPGEWPQEVPG